MRRQDMEDMAKLYAPNAARDIRNGHWDQATALLLERCQKLDMALQSLTPGGSEYVGEPDRCVAHAKATIDRYRSMWRAELHRTARIIELEQVIADVLEQFELLAKDPATNPWCVQMREALSPARPKQEDAT